MNLLASIQLNENDKRFLFIFLAALLFIIVIIWFIGYIITRIMKYQGKKLDDKVHDVIVTRSITAPTEKAFKKYANKKNWIMFLKESAIPLLIILIGGLCLLIGNAIINDFSYNPFADTEKGFASLLFLWDFENATYVTVFPFNFPMLSEWPPLSNTPHFNVEGIGSYLFVLALGVGGIWYLISCQASIARMIRIRQLCTKFYHTDLDELSKEGAPINQNQNTNI